MFFQYILEKEYPPLDAPELLQYVCTGDGEPANEDMIFPLLGEYYFDYVNYDETYCNFEEKINELENEDELYERFYGTSDFAYIDDCVSDYSNVIMMDVAKNGAFLDTVIKFSLGERVETDVCDICGIPSAYAYRVYFDGDDWDVFAVFSEEGNLLNIVFPPNFESYNYTWGGIDDEYSIYDMIPGLGE